MSEDVTAPNGVLRFSADAVHIIEDVDEEVCTIPNQDFPAIHSP